MTPVEVAFLCERFGWTLDTVMSLTVGQVGVLLDCLSDLDQLRAKGV